MNPSMEDNVATRSRRQLRRYRYLKGALMASGRQQVACDYCGLPLTASGDIDADSKLYCCFGCRFASKVADGGGADGQARWMLTRLGIAVFFSMNVMVFTMALWSRDVYHMPGSGDGANLMHELFRYACLIFSLPVVFLLGGPLLESALGELRRGRLTTDLLIFIGVVAALIYSAVSVLRGEGQVYFEVACMVLVALTLGRWLEATAKLKTTDTLTSLENLLPARVAIMRDDTFETAPLDEVKVGSFLRILPGQRFPVDGRIVRNRAFVDEQIMTGESRPVSKEVGDTVLGGTMNLDGDLTIEATSPPHGGSLKRLADAVRAAAEVPSRHQRLADRVAAAFIPVVAVIAVGVLYFHWQNATFAAGMLAALSVLLIACPCALGLATPLAWWAALGRAARRGVMFRDGDALSRLASVRAMCFDKTGTLTTGEAEVAKLVVSDGAQRSDVVAAAVALSQTNTHWTSDAIARWADADSTEMPTECSVLPGQGVVGSLKQFEGPVCLGSAQFMHDRGLELSSELRETVDGASREGQPIACIGWQGAVRGVIVFRDHIREDAAEAIAELKNSGIHVTVLTGDGEGQASSIGSALNVEVRAQLLPDEKLAAIQDVKEHYGMVAMVGDGVNDAPALAGADVGIALGCGADISRHSADVCVLSNEIAQVPWALELSRQTVRAVRHNLFWAFSYNIVGIGIAACGWLNPIFAAIAMVGSSVFVVTNSLRLAGKSDDSDENSGDQELQLPITHQPENESVPEYIGAPS